MRLPAGPWGPLVCTTHGVSARTIVVIFGWFFVVAGVVATMLPNEVADLFGQDPLSGVPLIERRAVRGGLLLAFGRLLLVRKSLKPWSVTAVVTVLCLMLGLVVARSVGWALDGPPDGPQWLYMVIELVVVFGAALWLRKTA